MARKKVALVVNQASKRRGLSFLQLLDWWREKVGMPRREVQITPPRLQTVEFLIVGTAPYVQHAFRRRLQNCRSRFEETMSQASHATPAFNK